MRKFIFLLVLFGSILSPVRNEPTHFKPVLLQRKEVIDMDILHRQKVLLSIMEEESRFQPDVINKSENAVGLLQIRPIMIREVNRLIGEERFTNTDRKDLYKSVEIFVIYQNHFNPEWDLEKAARLWNGGRNGMNKRATIEYAKRVEERYASM